MDPDRFSFEGRRCDRGPGAVSLCKFGQDSCHPIALSNGSMLASACVYACYSFIFLSDARCTVKQILRGLAPAHVMLGFALAVFSTIISVFMFAGREFAGAAESQLFEFVQVSLGGVYFILMFVMFCGHFRWRSKHVTNEESARRRRSSADTGFTDEGHQLSDVGFL